MMFTIFTTAAILAGSTLFPFLWRLRFAGGRGHVESMKYQGFLCKNSGSGVGVEGGGERHGGWLSLHTFWGRSTQEKDGWARTIWKYQLWPWDSDLC